MTEVRGESTPHIGRYESPEEKATARRAERLDAVADLLRQHGIRPLVVDHFRLTLRGVGSRNPLSRLERCPTELDAYCNGVRTATVRVDPAADIFTVHITQATGIGKACDRRWLVTGIDAASAAGLVPGFNARTASQEPRR